MRQLESDSQSLWKRLATYEFDRPATRFPYSAKVAKENGWTRGYALRVIEEYRRFAFLAATAGHPVSPSEAVDQAWHIHILYTHEYNQGFCTETLGMHLHHGPSRGGKKEDEKFHDWYEKTLASYRAFFGEEPPRDIWPTPEERATARHHFQRVDKSQYWLLPKPNVWLKEKLAASKSFRQAATGVAATVLAATPLVMWGCAANNGAVNPLDYDGPSFIQFYLVSIVLGIAAAFLVRHLYRPPGPDGGSTRKLDAIEIAYLNGGPGLVLQVTLASLVRGKLVIVSQRSVSRTAEPTPDGLTPIEATVLAATSTSGIWAKNLGDRIRSQVEAVKSRLRDEGLVMEDEAAYRNLLVTWLVGLAVPALGLAKLFVGVSRGRPVGILIALLFVSLIVLLVAFTSKKLRSRKGDHVLANLRENLAGYKSLVGQTGVNPSDVAMAVALFGIPALAGTPMFGMLRPIGQRPGAISSSGCGTSCGSSCGGSSGGGDGGGCGGGCGGGGCGGCGGS